MVSCVCLLLGVAPAMAKGDTLIVASPADAKTLDPHSTMDSPSQNAMKQIYECLVSYDDAKQTVVPSLAERWDVLEGKKGYKFYLKKGVKFHNGQEMKASDVVFSFKRATGPEGAGIHFLSNYVDPKGLEAVDDYTVIIRTKQPLGSAFLASMNHPWAAIMPQKAVEAGGRDYHMHPIGTGKFKFVSWAKGDRITFERFDNYHGEKAKLKKIVIRTVIEPSSRMIELESGAVDVALELQAVDVNRLKGDPAKKLIIKTGQAVGTVIYDVVNSKPYSDPRVRKALGMVVDRQGMVKAVFKGYAEVATGPISSAVKYNKVKESPVPKVDIEGAKKLLAEAGFPDGFKAVFMAADRADYYNVAVVLQDNFRKIGVDMEIKVLEWGAFQEAAQQPGHPPVNVFWWAGAPVLDPYFFYSALLSTNAGKANRAFLQDPQIDAMLNKGAELDDGPERAKLYSDLWDKVADIAPWTYLVTPYYLAAMDKNLEGLDLGPSLVNYYGNAYFKK